MDNAYNPITGEDPLPYSELAHLFLSIRTQIKLYHWQTRIYARHKATDRFLDTFEPLVDRFVEAAQGIIGNKRIESLEKLNVKQRRPIETFLWETPTDETAPSFLRHFRTHIVHLNLPQSELAQIRDDMLEISDVTLYLFTLE